MAALFHFRSADFPDSPGVYLMKDERGRIIYVGKAISLRKRLASYFRGPRNLSAKTRALVARVARVDVLAATTEKEALLLEESLIKKHRPRYNVVLRDDKQYLLFRLDKTSKFPRLQITRRVTRDGALYFGPFTSAQSARETWKLLGRIFPLRKCSEKVFRNRVRPCLHHHLNQCLAPCVRQVDEEAYRELVRRVERFLSGRAESVLAELKREMNEAAEALRFEQAAVIRDRMAAIRRTVERQAVVLPGGGDLDVLGLEPVEEGLGLGVVFVRRGRVLDEQAFHFPDMSRQEAAEVLEGFLVQFYHEERFIPARIVAEQALPDLLAEVLAERRGGDVRLARPRGQAERGLLELTREVARRAAPRRSADLLAGLERRLRLGRRPVRVEGVDISHLGGTGTRAGMVVFEEGRRLPKESRHYAFPELEGSSDDYAALAAWAARRVESGPPWPDLVLVDGGRGQLAAVERAFFEAMRGMEDAPILELAAIAKGETRRAGELGDFIFRPGRKNPVDLPPGGPELLFLQSVRDAAHRFVLGGQRRSRASKALKSAVLDLPGVGPKTARLLWERFGSLEALRAATKDDLRSVPGLGDRRAEKIVEALARLG
ncbi:excinuclease ABC subunit UvrC [Desulfovibrio aminophilus]|uniref:excinuclease ABC subunit UvrC n=1 Tax=Desulfovibrio aminophilus TaxID=81425 RepID=UPI0004247654|nr:excinuclease ABC subunit UvrC [Desulfovibrio aminophilus]